MRVAVFARWHEFSTPLEGRVHWPYCDIKGLITVGVGNLIDPIEAALPLPWTLPNGSLASRDVVATDWRMLKSQADTFKKLHYKYAEKVTRIRLTDQAIDELVDRKLRTNEFILARAFHQWDEWPADAQLGACSMAWAVGPGFPQIFKNFTRAANAGDWIAAKASCKIRTEGNPGVMPRNRANELCFENAATVIESHLDLERLWWPDVATADEKHAPPIDPRTDPQHVTDLAALTASEAYDADAEARRKAVQDAVLAVGNGRDDD